MPVGADVGIRDKMRSLHKDIWIHLTGFPFHFKGTAIFVVISLIPRQVASLCPFPGATINLEP